MKTLKKTRAVTYRRKGIPAVILEGKWLEETYRLHIGDVVDIDYQSKEIRLCKNERLSRQRREKLRQLARIKQNLYDSQTRSTGDPSPESVKHSG